MTEGRAEKKRRLPVTLAAVGLLLSLLLVLVHVSTYLSPSRESFCRASETLDCAAVAASPFSVALGLPWAVWGSGGFVALLVAAFRRSRWLIPLSLAASLTSLGLLGVSLTQVGALCFLCEAVHLTCFALLAVALRQRAELREPLQNQAGLLSIVALPSLLLVAAWLSVPHYWTAFSFLGGPHLPTGTTQEGFHTIGSLAPRRVVHEFTDYQCPHCGVAATRALRLLDRHPDVQLVRHDTPRQSCKPGRGGCSASRASICADAQGRFWQADRWLFTFANPRHALDLDKLARDVDLDAAQLKRCFDSEETYVKATERFRTAQKHHARFVPTYLIDGRRVEAADLAANLDRP